MLMNTSQSYGASPAIQQHTVFASHLTQENAPQLNSSMRGQYSINRPQTDERPTWPRHWDGLPPPKKVANFY